MAVDSPGGAGPLTRSDAWGRPVGETMQQLGEAGFAVAGRVDVGLLDELRSCYDGLVHDPDLTYFVSGKCRHRPVEPVDCNAADSRRVDLELQRLLSPTLERLVPGHRPVVAGFVVKGRNQGLPMEFHQDLTHTDETKHRSIAMWVPLVDARSSSGALSFVPGSHRWTRGIRPCAEPPFAPDGFQAEFARRMVMLEVAAGTVVVWDSAVVHGSAANARPYERPAVTMVAAPAAAQLVHFHVEDDGSLSGSAIDGNYFTTGVAVPGTPVRAWAPRTSAAEFASVLGPLPASGRSD